MNRLPYQLFFTLFLFTCLPQAHAGGSVEHSARALEMSLQAIGNSTLAGLKLASGAAAVPLMSVGEVGQVSGEIGDELWDEANTVETDAFPVSDETVTVGPQPDKQMERE